MIRIEKGGDIKFPVNSVAGLGQKYKIYFYTKRPDVNVSKTDLDVVEATEPYIPLPWSDLAMIGEGVMNLTVNNMTPDMSYDDGVYDNTFTRTTNYYIVNEGGDVPGSLEERVDALETGLAEEVERSETYDDNMTMLFNTLSDDLEQEETAREAADTALQTNLNTVNDGLNETIIQLTNEITNRQQADNQLSQDITSEAQQRQLADGNLQTAIDANASAISNINDELEQYALKSDVYDKTQIDNKVTEIYGSIGSEESSRIAGDENLQSQINKKANSSDVYTRTEVSSLLANKADKSTTYTKTEVDTALGNYYDKSVIDANELVTASALNDLNDRIDDIDLTDYYDKTAVDTLLSAKANQSTTYTKTEVDTAISTAVGTETTARQNADSALDTRVTALENAPAPTPYDDTEIRQIIEDNELVTASAISDLQDADAVLAGANASMDARVTVLESSIPDMSNYYTKSEVDTELADKADEATTLAGYGITDANINNGVITLGSNTITPLTQHQSLSNYYTKSEVYNKTEIDATIGDINTILASI